MVTKGCCPQMNIDLRRCQDGPQKNDGHVTASLICAYLRNLRTDSVGSLNRAATGVTSDHLGRSDRWRQAFSPRWRAKPPDVLPPRGETARVASAEKRGFLNISSFHTRWRPANSPRKSGLNDFANGVGSLKLERNHSPCVAMQCSRNHPLLSPSGVR